MVIDAWMQATQAPLPYQQPPTWSTSPRNLRPNHTLRFARRDLELGIATQCVLFRFRDADFEEVRLL